MPIYVRRLAFLGSRLAAARSIGTSHEQLCASPQENAIHNGLIPLESQELRAGVTCRRGASGGRSAGDAKPAADRSGQSARQSRQSAVGVRPASTSAVLVRRRGPGRQANAVDQASPACNAGKVPHVFWGMVPYATDHGERLTVVASAAPHECRRITHDAFRLQTLSGELPCDHGNDRHRVIRPASAARYFTPFGSGGEHACARPYEMRALIAPSRTLYERRQMRSQQARVWSAAVASAHQVVQRMRRSLPGALAGRVAFTRGSLREERLILELSRHQFTWLHNTLCGAGRLRCRGIADVAKQRQ